MSDRELIAAAQALIDGDRAEAWRYPTEWELLVARLKIAAQAQAVNQQLMDALEAVLECGSTTDQWWVDQARAAIAAAQEGK